MLFRVLEDHNFGAKPMTAPATAAVSALPPTAWTEHQNWRRGFAQNTQLKREASAALK